MREQCVPLGLHGDAGQMSKQKGALVLTWNPLIAQACTAQTRHIMMIIRKDQLQQSGETLEAIWELLAWSFPALGQACTPERVMARDLWIPTGLRLPADLLQKDFA